MRLAKLVTACGLTVALCAGCGITAKPLAGTPRIDRAPGNHARFEDPRYKHVTCLRRRFPKHHYHVTEFLAGPQQLFAFHVGTTPGGPTVVFETTPGAAEADQLQGGAVGAEVLGAALIYPNRAFDREMIRVEVCVGLGVIG